MTMVRWADPAEAADLIREAIQREGGEAPPPVRKAARGKAQARARRR